MHNNSRGFSTLCIPSRTSLKSSQVSSKIFPFFTSSPVPFGIFPAPGGMVFHLCVDKGDCSTCTKIPEGSQLPVKTLRNIPEEFAKLTAKLPLCSACPVPFGIFEGWFSTPVWMERTVAPAQKFQKIPSSLCSSSGTSPKICQVGSKIPLFCCALEKKL